MDWSNFLVVTLASAAAIGLLQLATWAWSVKAGKWAVVDVVWGAGFALVGLVTLAFGTGGLNRRLLLTVLVCVWGVRLSWHIFKRSQGKGEDPRYEKLTEGLSPFAAAIKVFGLQGVLQWIISMPLQASAAAQDTTGIWWVVLVIGVLIWGIGLTFESVGDAQLKAFMADPDNKGEIMDKGLWAWTRHPNYFGDACVWWGMFVVAASAGTVLVLWTVLAPVAMTHFLRNVSGAKLLEENMKDRPAFQEYMQRTAYFFPRPPKG
ncbi:MAG: DUF1295 domain-containing protein [Ornithinimicrobium sp.]